MTDKVSYIEASLLKRTHCANKKCIDSGLGANYRKNKKGWWLRFIEYEIIFHRGLSSGKNKVCFCDHMLHQQNTQWVATSI